MNSQDFAKIIYTTSGRQVLVYKAAERYEAQLLELIGE